MKLIFLGNGVLNSLEFYKRGNRDTSNPHIDPNAIALVNMLARKSGATIVVASQNRIYDHTKKLLSSLGLAANIELLPYHYKEHVANFKGLEIRDYVMSAKPSSYCIIGEDDTHILDEQKGNMIKVSYRYGITEEDVEKALTILCC